MSRSCCFTGYRPEKFPFDFSEENSDYQRMMVKMQELINQLATRGVLTYYCGCARGFDLFAGEAVLAMRDMRPNVRLICVVPFADMEKGWSEEWQERFNRVLAECDERLVLSDTYHRGAYAVRNRYMVDHSHCVVTYFDGAKGGTENTLTYAESKNRFIINLAEKNPALPPYSAADGYPYYLVEKPNR